MAAKHYTLREAGYLLRGKKMKKDDDKVMIDADSPFTKLLLGALVDSLGGVARVSKANFTERARNLMIEHEKGSETILLTLFNDHVPARAPEDPRQTSFLKEDVYLKEPKS